MKKSGLSRFLRTNRPCCVSLLRDNHFLRNGAILAGGYEEIDAIGTTFHVVGHGAGLGIVGLKLVDEMAGHVVHLHIDLASETLKVECHCAVVGIGDDVEVP